MAATAQPERAKGGRAEASAMAGLRRETRDEGARRRGLLAHLGLSHLLEESLVERRDEAEDLGLGEDTDDKARRPSTAPNRIASAS